MSSFEIDPETYGDPEALAALDPIDAVGTDEEPSAEPPVDWQVDAHMDEMLLDPAVDLTTVPDGPGLQSTGD